MDSKQLRDGRRNNQFCIDDLLYALKHVDGRYVHWQMLDPEHEEVNNSEISESNKLYDKEKIAYCERVFAYELYHQYRNLMCDNKRYVNYIFNGEQLKDDGFYKDLFKRIKKNQIIPDLILHNDLGSIKRDGQIMYIEIKTIKNPNVFLDLEKLSQLAKSELNFYYYIFIYVDATIDDLVQKLTNLKKKDYNELSDDILCICVKDQDANKIWMKALKTKVRGVKSKNTPHV